LLSSLLVDDEYRGFLPTTTIEKQTYSQRAIAFCYQCFSLILVDKKCELYMGSQGQESTFNIDAS
jgi:hypothetical protein